MKVAVFSSKPYDREFLEAAGGDHHEFRFLEPRLTLETVSLARGFPAVCVFVNDRVDAPVTQALAEGGTRLVALRCAGHNNVDLAAATRDGLTVVRVAGYSPHAVAEHTLGLVLALNRKLYRAYNRVREGNFALDGLLGFDLHGKTAGIIGTGRIGAIVARIFLGFGCRVLAFDPAPNPDCEKAGVDYVDLDGLLPAADIVTLHCPLTHSNRHLLDAEALRKMRAGAMLINTSRGALLDTPAVIDALKKGRLGSLGLDVYEEESDLFFEDRSGLIIPDDVFSRLLTFPNVLITGHQAFFTREALENIATTTTQNILAFAAGTLSGNELQPEP